MDNNSQNAVVATGWQKAVVIISKLIFTLLIAGSLAKLTWLLVAPVEVVLPEPSRGGSSSVSSNALTGIGDWHLLGELDAEPAEPVEKVEKLQETRLRLELLGVLSGPTPEESSAIIAPKGGKGSFYKVGQKLQGRTKLSAVYDDRVVLDTLGKLETLKFEERKGVNFQSKTSKTSSKPTSRSSKKSSGSLVKRLREQRSVGGFVDVINAEIEEDPDKALKELGLSPASGGGYKIGSSGSVLTSVGLKPGDIILSVNGQPLGDVNSDKELIGEVTASGKARIEVQRGNRRFVVNHDIGK